MGAAFGQDIGALFTSKLALEPTSAGGSALNGEVIDRLASRPLHISGKLMVGYNGAVPSGSSLTIRARVYHADEEGGPFVQLPAGTGGGNEPDETFTIDSLESSIAGTVEVDFNLIGAKQFIQAVVTPTPSSGTAEVHAVFGLGGGETIPAAGE